MQEPMRVHGNGAKPHSLPRLTRTPLGGIRRSEGGGVEQRGLMIRLGPLELDWPKTVGYYGGVGIALVCDLIAPPLALFIAAIPVLKLFKTPAQPGLLRIAADTLEGAARPVGGDADAIIRVVSDGPRLVARRPRRGERRIAARGSVSP
jgi:hypothetical protein